MKSLTPQEERVLLALSNAFFQVVPLTLRQHCSLTSRISQTVLQHFDIASELLPCQLWYVAPNKNIVIGFNDHPPALHRWNGHVVCNAGNWFIDAATYAYKIEFALEVPSVAAIKRFGIPSQALGRLDLNEREHLWWLAPPQGLDTTPSQEPQDLIALNAARLIERLSLDTANATGTRSLGSVTASQAPA